jgi:uncharacterized protein
MVDVIALLEKYAGKNTPLFNTLLEHSSDVANRALRIAARHPEMNLDHRFIWEAAMLHDIGCVEVHAPEIHCYGPNPYICHGYLGADLLRLEGYPRHALVCERHTGVGLTLEEIQRRELPIPHRDMVPLSLEEQIICYADLFYSKTKLGKEKSISKLYEKVAKYSAAHVLKLDHWVEQFETNH